MTKNNPKGLFFFLEYYYYETVLKKKERKKINLLKLFPHLSILHIINLHKI